MPAQPGVTLTFSVPVGAPTQLSVGLTNRRYMIIVNNPFLADGVTPNTNYIAYGIGTLNTVTVNYIPIPPGGNFEIGAQWIGFANVPALDVSVIALTANGGNASISGNPQVSFWEF